VFVLWDRRYAERGREPVVDLRLFRLRSYSFGTGMITLYFAGFTPLFFVFTLYLQIGLKYSALAAGVAITPFAIGSGLSAALGGRVVHRFGRPLVAAGLVLVGIGFAGSLLAVREVPSHGTGWATLAPLLVAGLGGGLVITPNQTLTLSEVPVPRAGTAGGLLQTGQRVGAAVGIAAVGAVFFAEETNSHDDATAYQHGIVVALAFVVAALVVAGLDIVVDRAAGSGRSSRGRHSA
jgi:MFS family permease